MFKDLFHKETFAFFLERFATGDLLVRSAPRPAASKLFLFDASGFVLFYVFVVIAKTVYRGGTIDPADLITPVFLFVLLLYIGGVLFFVMGLFGLSKGRLFDLFENVVLILLISLAVFAADRFSARALFGGIDAATCGLAQLLQAPCARWVHKSMTAGCYGAISVALLAINTAKIHGPALRIRPALVWPVVCNAALTSAIGIAVVIVVLRAFVMMPL